MKKKWNSVAVIGIIALLGIGYFIPMGIMWIEDWNLKMQQSKVEIKPIQLDSQKVDVIEELSVFADMLSNRLVVDVGPGFSEDYDANQAVQDEMSQIEGTESEQSTSRDLKQKAQDFLLLMDVKEEIVLEKFQATNYVMMVEKNAEQVYSIWESICYDEAGKEYYLWIDASTEKVMAFDIPYQVIGHSDEGFQSMIWRLWDYYALSDYGLLGTNLAEDQTNLYKTKYWKNEIRMLDAAFEVQLSVCIYKEGDRLLFNMHPQ